MSNAIVGILNTADASAGLPIPLYDADTRASRTLQSDERLIIDALAIVAESGGDIRVFYDTDNDDALDTGEGIARGTFGVNGGVVHRYERDQMRGSAGAVPHVLAPAGTVDVQITGRIEKVMTKAGPSGAPGHYVG